MNPELRPCLVCGRKVMVDPESDAPVICINDYFSEDPTEEWEADE